MSPISSQDMIKCYQRKMLSSEEYSLGNIVNYDGRVSPAIVHGGKRIVPFLTSCIPNLKFKRILVHLQSLR